MKYTYDTNGLKNAMIYALNKAAKDAGFDRKDFKPITVDVKKTTRPVMFDATLNYRIVKDGYVRSSDGSTEGIFTFFDIPVNEDIKKECFTEGRFLRYYDNFVEDLKNFVSSSDLRSVEAQIDDFKDKVKKVADVLSKKYGCGIDVEFYKTTNKSYADIDIIAYITKLKIDNYTLENESKLIDGLYLTIKTDTNEDKKIFIGFDRFYDRYAVDQLEQLKSDLEAYITDGIIKFSEKVEQITEAVDIINSSAEKLDNLCDNIEALCDENGHEATCTLKTQYYVPDSKPVFNLSVSIEDFGLQNYFIPYDEVDKKCRDILKSIKKRVVKTTRSASSDTITF